MSVRAAPRLAVALTVFAVVAASCSASGTERQDADVRSAPAAPETIAAITGGTPATTEPAAAWVAAADNWAKRALDAAVTVGELLGDPGTRRAVLRGDATDAQERVRAALRQIAPTCRDLGVDVPQAPAEYRPARAHLVGACDELRPAASLIARAIGNGRSRALERGLHRLARGVNAIGRAYELLGPALA